MNLISPKYLCITSATLIIPFSFYMNNAVYRWLEFPDEYSKNEWESGLATILFFAIYASQVFWSNPEKDSFIHKMDRIIAKITIGSFLVYVIFYKERWKDPVFDSLVLIMCYFAVMSHVSSSEEWCGYQHLLYHGGLHLVGATSAIYAFI